jgi:putative heme-binding domain-containing protein
VADVGSNLIHRKRLVPDGVTYRGERIDQETEFVRSRDIWFRPVQMAIGPEGGLYVADMYRETIEHPDSLPPALKRQLDLTSAGRGRIYRIVPRDYQNASPRPLTNATTEQLVKSLDDANMWQRTTASRLLQEQQDKNAVDLLRAAVVAARRPDARIAALYALAGLNSLQPQVLMSALGDAHPQVRRHALRLSEPLLDSSSELVEKVLSLVDDTDLVVQFQLALSLSECDDSRVAPALAGIIAQNMSQPDVVAAALTSIGPCAGRVLQALLEDRDRLESAHAAKILSAIVVQIVRQRREEDLAALNDAVSPPAVRRHPLAATKLIRALSRHPADALASSDSPQLAKLRLLRKSAAADAVQNAKAVLQNANALDELRKEAITDLALGTFEAQRPLFEQLLSPQESPEIREAVLTTIASFDSADVGTFVLSRWQTMAPAERSQATDLLLRRETWALELVQHLQSEGFALTTLEPTHVSRLQNFPSAAVRKAVLEMSGGGISSDRRQLFNDYQKTALASGDAERGKALFEKNCATCHALDSGSDAVGPNLLQMVKRGRESLLFNILVPNGEIDPRYLEYVVLTADGEVVNGLIAGETSTAISIRTAEKETKSVLRVDIEELRNTGRSLMPEGFEKVIDQAAMADLLEYLEQAAAEGESP